MAKSEALEWKFWVNLGSRTANFVNFVIFVEKGSWRTEKCWNGGLRELLREREKRVLRAAHPRTPFQGEYPPDFEWAVNSLIHRSQERNLRWFQTLYVTLTSRWNQDMGKTPCKSEHILIKSGDFCFVHE